MQDGGAILKADVALRIMRSRAEDRVFPEPAQIHSRLIVASPCSGHGAKFAPAIGDKLARLAIDPAYEVEPFFQLSRYSAFA